MKPVYCDHRAVCLSNPFTPSNVSFLYPSTYFLVARSAGVYVCVWVCVSRTHLSGGFSLGSGRTSLAEERRGPFIHCWMSVSTGCSPWWKKVKRKTPCGNPAKMMNSGAHGELIDIWGEALQSDGREETGPPVWADVTPALPLQQEGKPPWSWNGLTLVQARNARQISIWLIFGINNNNYNHNNTNNNKSV